MVQSKKPTKETSNLLDRFSGNWYCYKYIKDNRFQEEFSQNYAKEFSRYSYFKLEKDLLYINGGCADTVNYYKYATKINTYNDESVFVTFLKPARDSVEFLGITNVDNICNEAFKTLYVDSEKLVTHDRGYLFFFEKNKKSLEYIGIPGDNRGQWRLHKSFKNTSIEKAYEMFRQDFPYGSENLSAYSKEKHDDTKNLITYAWENTNKLVINKSNEMGTIVITFYKKGLDVVLDYQMTYPEN